MNPINLAQMGESPELDKIKNKIFGKKVKLPSESIVEMEKFEKEKNLHTFVMARQELKKDLVPNKL